jgi:hypothetical protein
MAGVAPVIEALAAAGTELTVFDHYELINRHTDKALANLA